MLAVEQAKSLKKNLALGKIQNGDQRRKQIASHIISY